MRKYFEDDGDRLRFECLWGRGILPASLRFSMPPLSVDDVKPIQSPEFDILANQSCRFYTDGSGGPRWVPKDCKVAGSSAATLRLHSTEMMLVVDRVGLVVAPTPGQQTVPRAELWGGNSRGKDCSLWQLHHAEG